MLIFATLWHIYPGLNGLSYRAHNQKKIDFAKIMSPLTGPFQEDPNRLL